MKMIGFPISHKKNENRRAMIPNNIAFVKNPQLLYFEIGYGNVLGYTDEDYQSYGANMVSREEVLKKDIICDPKIGDAEYLSEIHDQTVFGWLHAVQNRDITDKIINSKLTAYAWEDMFDQGRHVFWRNNEIAGEAAIMHAFQCYGEMPYNTNVAILGRGNTAQGALKILTLLGANVRVYDRKTENLFKEELGNYDVIVNAILWDTSRQDHIIFRDDLKRMKKNALIIDISCDRNGGIETSVPTTINNPVYSIDGIMHYSVDHTPSLFFRTISRDLSSILPVYINDLLSECTSNILNNAKAFEHGIIIDERICKFQKR